MVRTIKQSTLEERKIIVSNYLDGKTEREISNIVKKSKSTVHDVIKRYKEHNRLSNKQRMPLKRKLSPRDEKFIVHEVQKDPFISAPKLATILKNNFGKEVLAETVRRVLRKNNLNGRVARKKPCISEKNRKQRLEFAREHISKDFSFWSTVLFTDESKFNLFGSDGRRYVWRKPNEEFCHKNTKKTVKHGGLSVMVWGCMAASGVGNLHFIEGTMDKNMYLNILKANVKQSAHKLGIADNFKFYQDYDPKHTSLIAKNWLLYNCPKVLKTPAQSPDINVIEHLWDELGRRMQNRLCTSKDQLKAALLEEWNQISPDVCKKLVESIPKRLQAVENQKGYATKY